MLICLCLYYIENTSFWSGLCAFHAQKETYTPKKVEYVKM